MEYNNKLNVVTWNVNGIRSRVFKNLTSTQLKKNTKLTVDKDSSFYNLINETNADIICLQETRCSELYGNEFIDVDGYHKYFNESKLSDARSANRYSGTAIFTKIKPINIEYQVPDYNDLEGRMIIAYYENFIIINVYSPNSGTNYDNKILFQNSILNFTNTLTQPIIYCGDLNIAVDTHFDKTKVPPCPGTYKHELDYYKQLINNGFIDSKSTKDNIIFTWWEPRSIKTINPETNKETGFIRYKNKGWRLDYIFTKKFNYSESYVLKHIGEEYSPHASDHAPVYGKFYLK